ncbi:NAD(P)/FAD-dependent oxidoreductase [Planctobacterium marinum]|uniref:NAD(P)/FAD-dependent oxidoreductase n=1 Tax=Planctobacterium marinum TaxID=1631968 RepID=UPI001E4B86B8|nr:NAD(P)/FAD-dependent oxidoreductase [Planctobacterium marinum]MCC2603773.1 NAD(P)/FAD-dependent oxidoreductase [Planctobacterium marinum]
MGDIVIVGGGAGGLELAVKLGRYFKKSDTNVLLVDKNRTHIWKPLLHEVAAGSLDADIDCLDYLALSQKNGFQFQLGEVTGLERATKTLKLAAMVSDSGETILPAREIVYGKLVFALGSVTNDFGTPGVKEHCIFLDSAGSAQRFHVQLLNEFLKLQSDSSKSKLDIAIVGAGATGVELAAELYKTAELLKAYGYQNVSSAKLKVTVIEAGPRLLPALPERIAQKVAHELRQLGVSLMLNTAVSEASKNGLQTRQGDFIPADMSVWAAGIKAPEFLFALDGLETNRINQLVVDRTLQTSNDANIFAIGDCAHCIMPDDTKVPPRAQSAHQMASCLFDNIKRLHTGQQAKAYQYVDYGSLVSLSSYSTIGSLMGSLSKGSVFIEGKLARMVYISLYRMHQMVVYGKLKTLFFMLVNRINKRLRPTLKLH